ncbi:MAG: DUF4129 domain-containing protein [Acidimicrobiia bacterium]
MSDLTEAGPLRLLILVATAGTIAWAVGTALSESISFALLMAMVVLTVLEAEASWQLTSQRELPRQQLRSIRIAEMILGFAVIKVMQLSFAILGGDAAGALQLSLFDGEALIVWLVCLGAWIFATGTISDLERLGSPSEPSPGYRPPLPVLTTRFLMGGVVIIAAGALALVELRELPDPARPPALGFFWPAVVYFLMVMLILGAIRQQETQLQWRRQNMNVAPEVPIQWWSGVGVVVGLAALVMFAVPLVRGGEALSYVYDRIIAFVAWAAGGLGITFRIGSEEVSPSAPLPDPEQIATLATGESSSLVSEVIDITAGFAFLVVMAALALAALRLIRGLSLPLTGLGGSNVTAGLLRALWLAISAVPRLLLWAVRTFVAWLRRVTAASTETPGDTAAPATSRPSQYLWGAGDENRKHVAELYRRFLESASRRLVARRQSETPREYGTTISGLVSEPKPVGDLTDTFNEARYSRHPIVDEDVGRARGSLESFEDALEDQQPTDSGGNETP